MAMTSPSPPPLSLPPPSPAPPASEGGVDIDTMARNLTQEAERYNMSVEDVLNRLTAVSLRPGVLGNNDNGSSGGGGDDGDGGIGDGVEISSGVAWTLVAPLILLAVLVLVGVAAACLWRLKDRSHFGDGVEISIGVAWTLVAPLVLLVVLVLVGVAAACLWKLKDRRSRTGRREENDGEEGDGSPAAEIELHELHGDQLHSHPGTSAGASAADGHPQGFRGDPARYLHPMDGERRPWSHHSHHHHRHHHPRPPGNPCEGDGQPDPDPEVRGSQYLGPADLARRKASATMPEKLKLMSSGQGNGQSTHLSSTDALDHVRGDSAAVPRELYCKVCQHHVPQRYFPHLHVDHPHPHPHPPPNRHPGHHGDDRHHGGGQDGVKHCQRCAPYHEPRHGGGTPHPKPTPHHSLPRGSPLHLAPRYHPPHPAVVETQQQHRRHHNHHHRHDTGEVGPLQDASLDTLDRTGQMTRPLYNGRGRTSARGVENPLFTDTDLAEPNVLSESSRPGGEDTTAEGGRGVGGRVPGQGGPPRIINSTSLPSSRDEEGTTLGQSHHTQGHPTKAHLFPGKRGDMARVVEGPDVSSIRMLSSTSQAWRGSRVLLPSVTTVTTTTIISSTETPSFHSNTNASDGDHEDEEVGGEEEEETLSLPSSISRFHASRVQFPPLMPDAVYPLTSTKAFCSPSWPARSGGKGPEGPSSSAAGGDLLDSLDRFSDNTSTQPNVGSSVTSGQASQTVSSSATQSPARRTRRDHRSRSSSAHGDEAQPGRAVPAHRRHARATNAGDGDDEHSDSLTNASDSSEHSRPRAGHRAHLPQPVSPDFPISASELARGRKREKKRPGSDSGPEDEKSEKKHGFFIIPGSGAAKDAGNVHKAANDAGGVAGDVQENGSNDARPGFFVSPSRQPVRHRRQANPRGRVSDGAKQDQGTQDRPPLPPPPVPRNSMDSQRNRPSISADDPRATHGQKKAAQSAEQHPVKLYTCKTPHVPHTEAGPQRSNQQASQRDLRARTSAANKIPVTGPSRDNAPRSVNELTAPRTSSLSASFPSVHGHQGQGRDTSINLPPRAATLDSSRSSCWSQGRLKRAKSHGHEDYAYINMGGSFSEAQQQAGLKELVYSAVKLGLVRDARQPLPSMSSKPVQNQTTPPIFGQQKSSAMPRQQKTGITLGQHETPSSQADNGRKQQDDVSTAKTDSQILSDILNSFPQTSLTPATTTTTTGNADDRDNNNEIKNDLLGSLYPDVTIPTAFADELFGIWSLSPELDEEVVLSNQPRTQLMTPLKVEARRANRKFLWGTSSSQSGSTSTSSFAPGWQLEEGSSSAGGATRRRSAHHRSLAQDDIFGDYVDMSLPTNRDRARDRIRSSPSQMSVSNPTSPDTMPPPNTEAVEVEGDTVTRDTGEYRGVSVPNNLNLSQLYVISGVPDNDDVNNNTATSTAVMNATGNKGGTGGVFPTPRVADNNNVPTLSGSTELVQQNRHSSAPSAFAVVLNQKQFWL